MLLPEAEQLVRLGRAHADQEAALAGARARIATLRAQRKAARATHPATLAVSRAHRRHPVRH
jgi:hypothetical protein